MPHRQLAISARTNAVIRMYRLEALEGRHHFADISAEVRNGILYLTGTDAADHFALVGGGDFDASIEGLGDTTINGERENFSLLVGSKPVVVTLGGGDDVLEIADGSWWSGKVSVLGGSGNDRVVTTPAYYNSLVNLFFAGGDGDDTLNISNREVSGRIDFEGGPGRDRAYLENVTVAGRLNVFDLTGPTIVTATDVAVRRPITIQTGNATDRVNFNRVGSRDRMIIRTRGGTDRLEFLKSPFSSLSVIKLGGQDDELLIA